MFEAMHTNRPTIHSLLNRMADHRFQWIIVSNDVTTRDEPGQGPMLGHPACPGPSLSFEPSDWPVMASWIDAGNMQWMVGDRYRLESMGCL